MVEDTRPSDSNNANAGHHPACEREAGHVGPCEPNAFTATTYGMCLSCRSIEVALNKAIGTRDFSGIGESDRYPTGYGCEVCS